MCGIIGYIGTKEANAVLIAGLERLEYRGYDSAGICTAYNQTLHLNKKKGRVETLKTVFLPGTQGIGHTRWSTHGIPSDYNAHPFTDTSNRFCLVHNGIIENYLELKEELRKEGVSFTSDTDSEVLVHLIARNYQGSLKEAVLAILPTLQGAYAFCVMNNEQEEIVGARNGSPLVLGIGEQEHFLASDVSAIVEHTKKVVYLNDFEVASITRNKAEVVDFEGREKPLTIKTINWNLEQAQKQGYKHFMLKEIMEQEAVIRESLQNPPLLEGTWKRIIILACGTAGYAGLLIKYLIEHIAGLPVNCEIASEFRYKKALFQPHDLVLAISQSGETADTLAAIRLAKKHGVQTLGLINVVDSTIAREVDAVLYTKAGPEIGVASTKAFTAQIMAGYQLAHLLAGKPFQPQIMEHVRKVLSMDVRAIAQKYYLYQNFLYIGRNLNYPLAMEGALKLKEISYIHAEGYPAGELKHGPIALVSEEMPTLAICPKDSVYEKTLSNIEEIKARNGKVIAIATEGDTALARLCDDVIYVPQVEEILYPLLITIPLQLLAYHIADLKECDIDKPRNLAKSVTVE